TIFSRDWSSDVCSSDLPFLKYAWAKVFNHNISLAQQSAKDLATVWTGKIQRYASLISRLIEPHKGVTTFGHCANPAQAISPRRLDRKSVVEGHTAYSHS